MDASSRLARIAFVAMISLSNWSLGGQDQAKKDSGCCSTAHDYADDPIQQQRPREHFRVQRQIAQPEMVTPQDARAMPGDIKQQVAENGAHSILDSFGEKLQQHGWPKLAAAFRIALPVLKIVLSVKELFFSDEDEEADSSKNKTDRAVSSSNSNRPAPR